MPRRRRPPWPRARDSLAYAVAARALRGHRGLPPRAAWATWSRRGRRSSRSKDAAVSRSGPRSRRTSSPGCVPALALDALVDGQPGPLAATVRAVSASGDPGHAPLRGASRPARGAGPALRPLRPPPRTLRGRHRRGSSCPRAPCSSAAASTGVFVVAEAEGAPALGGGRSDGGRPHRDPGGRRGGRARGPRARRPRRRRAGLGSDAGDPVMRVGFAGRVAHAFLDSKLTPLLIAASLGLGALALLGDAARGGAADPRPHGGRHRRLARGGARRDRDPRRRAPRAGDVGDLTGRARLLRGPPRSRPRDGPLPRERIERGEPGQGLRAAVRPGRGLARRTPCLRRSSCTRSTTCPS